VRAASRKSERPRGSETEKLERTRRRAARSYSGKANTTMVSAEYPTRANPNVGFKEPDPKRGTEKRNVNEYSLRIESSPAAKGRSFSTDDRDRSEDRADHRIVESRRTKDRTEPKPQPCVEPARRASLCDSARGKDKQRFFAQCVPGWNAPKSERPQVNRGMQL